VKRVILPIVLCLLIGTVANVALSAWLLTQWPRRKSPISPSITLQGAQVAGRDWPFKPPLDWPKPNNWGEWRFFGYRGLDVRHSENQQAGFAMTMIQCGWPMPVVYKVDMWWPWDDPKWTSNADSDVPIYPIASGWIGNSLIFALAAWLLLFAAPSTVRGYITHIRRSRRLCPHCGYPIGNSPICSECGRPVTSAASPPVKGT
jgi:hypothetical protein